jgi:hypothetical protein
MRGVVYSVSIGWHQLVDNLLPIFPYSTVKFDPPCSIGIVVRPDLFTILGQGECFVDGAFLRVTLPSHGPSLSQIHLLDLLVLQIFADQDPGELFNHLTVSHLKRISSHTELVSGLSAIHFTSDKVVLYPRMAHSRRRFHAAAAAPRMPTSPSFTSWTYNRK